VGADQALVQWSWKSNIKPPAIQEELYMQILPAISEEEERRRVVDIVFSRILSSTVVNLKESDDFSPVHTSENGQRIQWPITNDEQKECKKVLRLIPNYTYEVSLGVVTSERFVQKSNVSRIRLGFVVLDVTGSGELCKSSGRKEKRRELHLGQNALLSKKKHQMTPSYQKRNLSGQGLAAEVGQPDSHNEPLIVAQWQLSNMKEKQPPAGSSDEGFSSSWLHIPGLSVTALDMEDLEPKYHRCFKTYGYRDDFESSSAVAELMTELSEVGTISQIKSLPQKHLWVLTSSHGWEAKGSTQLGDLLGSLLLDLGASREEAEAVTNASQLMKSESGRGCRPFAFVGVTPVSSTTAFCMPIWQKNHYAEAHIKIALSFDDRNWFPAFKLCAEHWEVWTAQPVEDKTGAKFQRVRTSKDLKLRRNHIIIDELEEICKYFAPNDATTIPFDLTTFLQIVFDMIEGYGHGNNDRDASGGADATSQSNKIEYEVHDSAITSPQAFSKAVASLSMQLESVLTKLLQKYRIASQLVEAGVVEFLCSRMAIHKGKEKDNERIMSSLWLLISLTSKEPCVVQSPRQYSAEDCQMLLDFSKAAQPRLLPELYRRGGVTAVLQHFESCWTEASHFANYQMLHRMSIFMLQVAEMKTLMLRISFSYDWVGAREVHLVNALESQLPTKTRGIACPTGKVVVADVLYVHNQSEPEKNQSWGPGWASSGELLGFSQDSLKKFKGCLVLLPAASNWKKHCATMLQACRLVWLASVAGAAGVIFVWPGPTIQQIHPNLNFAQHSEIPSYILPHSKEIANLCKSQTAELTAAALVEHSKDIENLLMQDIFEQEKLTPAARHIGSQFYLCLKNIVNLKPKVHDNPKKKRPIRILSLDGGGVKGLSTIFMLKQLLECIKDKIKSRNKQKSEGSDQLSSFFDLIVGTSAGGIISLGMGSGMSLDNIEAFYNDSVHEIFASKDSYWEQLQRGPGASAARRLREIIRNEWPERSCCSMSADSPIFSIPFHQPKKNLDNLPAVGMLTTLVSREPSRTCMFKSYLSNSDLSMPYLPAVHRATILQSIRATSAAPYYLEEMLCHSDICTGEFFPGDMDIAADKISETTAFHLEPVYATYRFVDGAISVNNPTSAAIIEARTIYPDHPLVVVSLGTGSGLPRLPIKTFPSGIGVVLQNLISSTADVSLSDAQAEHMLTSKDTYFRFCPCGDVYNCDMGTNDKKIIEEILAEATNYIQSTKSQQKLKTLVSLLCNIQEEDEG
jgi:hypothetical protein